MKQLSSHLLLLLSPAFRRRFAVLAVLVALGAAAEALGVGAVLPFISLLAKPSFVMDNAAMRAAYEWLGAPGIERFTMLCGFALILLFVAKNAYLGLLYFMQSRFVYDLESHLDTSLLEAYLHGSYADRLGRNSSDRIRLITTEVSKVTSGFVMPLLVLLTESLVVVGLGLVLLWLRPEATIAAVILIGGIGAILQRAFRRRTQGLRERRLVANKAMHQWATQALGAIKETKVLGREDFFMRRFRDNSRAGARATSAFIMFNMMPRLAVETLAVTALLLVVIVGLAMGQPMDGMVPLLTLFGLAAVRIMPSATRIMHSLNNLRFYAPSLAEVAGDLAALPPPEASARPLALAVSPARFDLRGVRYRYAGRDEDILQGVDFGVARGEIVGIVGPSGSGKTTLADVLLGLLEPGAGEFLVDGRPVRVTDMRGVAGLVPQQFYLLDDTVRRNVAFGREDDEIDDAQVWRALDRARLGDTVRALPLGLDEPVREQGAVLSGGERQRLSIARALYDDPAILVLDEATSALDSATEAEIMSTLRAVAETTAIVLITHRPLSMAACDRIVMMQGGRSVAEGSYSDLLAGNAEFGEIARMAE